MAGFPVFPGSNGLNAAALVFIPKFRSVFVITSLRPRSTGILGPTSIPRALGVYTPGPPLRFKRLHEFQITYLGAVIQQPRHPAAASATDHVGGLPDLSHGNAQSLCRSSESLAVPISFGCGCARSTRSYWRDGCRAVRKGALTRFPRSNHLRLPSVGSP